MKVVVCTNEDFTAREEKYDIVYDAVMKSKYADCKKILVKNGVFLNNSGLLKNEAKDLVPLKELIENNKLKPIMDKVYSIDEVVEAHRYVDIGHKKGNVAIRVLDS